jgi:hypothetical protein
MLLTFIQQLYEYAIGDLTVQYVVCRTFLYPVATRTSDFGYLVSFLLFFKLGNYAKTMNCYGDN